LIACSLEKEAFAGREAHELAQQKLPFNNSTFDVREICTNIFLAMITSDTAQKREIQVSDKELKRCEGERQKGDVTHILLRHHHYWRPECVMGEVIYVL
jgi:hypothetical protein